MRTTIVHLLAFTMISTKTGKLICKTEWTFSLDYYSMFSNVTCRGVSKGGADMECDWPPQETIRRAKGSTATHNVTAWQQKPK